MTQNLSQNPDMITCLWCQLCLFELFEFCPTWPSKRIWTVSKWKPLTLLAWLYLHFTTHIEGYLDISGYHKAIKQFLCIGLWYGSFHSIFSDATCYHSIYIASAPKFHLSQPPLLVPQVRMPQFFSNALAFRFVLFHSHPKASTAKRSAKSGNIFGTTCQALRISWNISMENQIESYGIALSLSSKGVPCGPMPWGKPAWWRRNFGEPRL